MLTAPCFEAGRYKLDKQVADSMMTGIEVMDESGALDTSLSEMLRGEFILARTGKFH